MTGDEGVFSPPPVAFREHIVGSQEWRCHTTLCPQTKKKGVRLWLIAMVKGL